jgi:hypothetical protein
MLHRFLPFTDPKCASVLPEGAYAVEEQACLKAVQAEVRVVLPKAVPSVSIVPSSRSKSS